MPSKDIYYVHNTPLAGLAAHLHTGQVNHGEAALLGELPFLDLPEHLEPAGKDDRGRTVYGLWTREADPVLIKRLARGFLQLHNRPPGSYEIRLVPDGGRLAPIAFLFKRGFYRTARRLLAGRGRAALGDLTPAPGID